MDSMLGRSWGCIGRVRGSAGRGGIYGRRTAPTATGASIQISGGGKGLKPFSFGVDHLRTAGSCVLNSYPVRALLRPYGFKAVIPINDVRGRGH